MVVHIHITNHYSGTPSPPRRPPGGRFTKRSPWRLHPKSTIYDVRGGREVYEWLVTCPTDERGLL